MRSYSQPGMTISKKDCELRTRAHDAPYYRCMAITILENAFARAARRPQRGGAARGGPGRRSVYKPATIATIDREELVQAVCAACAQQRPLAVWPAHPRLSEAGAEGASARKVLPVSSHVCYALVPGESRMCVLVRLLERRLCRCSVRLVSVVCARRWANSPPVASGPALLRLWDPPSRVRTVPLPTNGASASVRVGTVMTSGVRPTDRRGSPSYSVISPGGSLEP